MSLSNEVAIIKRINICGHVTHVGTMLFHKPVVLAGRFYHFKLQKLVLRRSSNSLEIASPESVDPWLYDPKAQALFLPLRSSM